MGLPIAYLRDNFADNIIAPLWLVYPYASVGSATRSESSGQAQIALPSSVAGAHQQAFYSAATYDITDDGSLPDLRFNIAQMVSTSVAALAIVGLISDNQTADGTTPTTNQLRWLQQSGTLKAQKVVLGVPTDLYSVSWNATTHKHLRIREESGSVYFDSSTDGITWTQRATATVASLGFAITDMHVLIYAQCGNVASPGTLKIEEVNGFYPALATTWRSNDVKWSLQHRFRSITLAAGNALGYIAASQDGTTWRYFAGPLGSASGLYNQLVEYATQAEAEAAAADIPYNTLGLGRWDLPEVIECRFFRLYHRSIAAGLHYLYEFYPRRLVQADDVEAEKIRAIHIAANSITADRLSVIKLSAITANIGQLFIDTNGYLFQGTGSGTPAENAANPTSNSVTGLKIYHSSGIGKLSTYNAGVEQIKLDTDGRLKAGAGNVVVDATGIKLTARSINIYSAIPTVPNVIAWQSGGNNIATIEGFIDTETSNNVLSSLVETSSSFGRVYIRKDLVNIATANNIAQGSGISIFAGTAQGINYGTDADHHFFVDNTERLTIGPGSIRILNGGVVGAAGNATFSTFSQNAANNAIPIRVSYGAGGLFHAGIVWYSDDNNATKPKVGMIPLLRSTGSELYIGTSNNYTTGLINLIYMDPAGDWLPGTTGAQNLGNASFYWNDVSYKTLTDRGCLAYADEWELNDGRVVDAIEAIKAMRPHPTEKTIYGEVKIDYSTAPKHSYKAAPIATEDIHEFDVKTGKERLRYKKGDKMGEDGVEMTSTFSMMLSAIRKQSAQIEALQKEIASLKG